MEEKELKELFKLLEQQGMNPMLCDNPVAISANSAKCVIPTEIAS